jgi:ATP-dependent Zn protease
MNFVPGQADLKRLEIAYHEIGHAIMSLLCEQRLISVSLKETDSPYGTGKYLGSTTIEPFHNLSTYTINEGTRRIRIALGGFAGEIPAFGSTIVGADDLARAVTYVDNMMQSEDFRNYAASLSTNQSNALNMIQDPNARAFIAAQLNLCVDALRTLEKPFVALAHKLCEQQELTGEEVIALIDSFVDSSSSKD